MNEQQKIALIHHLSEYVTENKQKLMGRVLQERTRYLTIVLEDIYQAHNSSAVVRSCDAFGVQDVHVVEKRHRFSSTQSISRGATQWLSIYKYKETSECFDALKKDGYKIYATAPPGPKAYRLKDLPINHKIALIFGTERQGLTDYAMQHADGLVTIPMVGFTESFNISVSTALCMYQVIQKLHASSLNWKLTEQEKIDVHLNWLRTVVPAACELERRFLSEE